MPFYYLTIRVSDHPANTQRLGRICVVTPPDMDKTSHTLGNIVGWNIGSGLVVLQKELAYGSGKNLRGRWRCSSYTNYIKVMVSLLCWLYQSLKLCFDTIGRA
ncbi:hypothetical protein ES703_68509 [subsurface metagenome]